MRKIVYHRDSGNLPPPRQLQKNLQKESVKFVERGFWKITFVEEKSDICRRILRSASGNGPKTSKNCVVFGRGLAEFVESYPKICREVNEKVHLQIKFCNLQKDSEIGNQIAENHNLQKWCAKLQKTVRKFAENGVHICRKPKTHAREAREKFQGF